MTEQFKASELHHLFILQNNMDINICNYDGGQEFSL